MTTTMEQAPGIHFNQNQGVPQGGPFSPLLFNLNIKDLMNDLPDKADPSLYIDDLLVLCPPEEASRIIYKIQKQAASMGMEINYGEGKTEIINPTRETFDTRGIREVNQYEYLGVTIKKTSTGKYDSTFAH